jgi:hypothetical protein
MDSISAVTLVRAASIDGICTATALMERSGMCLLGDGSASAWGNSSEIGSGASGEISKRSPNTGFQLPWVIHINEHRTELRNGKRGLREGALLFSFVIQSGRGASPTVKYTIVCSWFRHPRLWGGATRTITNLGHLRLQSLREDYEAGRPSQNIRGLLEALQALYVRLHSLVRVTKFLTKPEQTRDEDHRGPRLT